MERTSLALGLWCCTALALYLCRRRSPFSPIVLALMSTAVVGSFFPIASMFVQPLSWRNLGSISEASIVSAQAQYLAFACGLLVAVFGASNAGWLGAALPIEVHSPKSRVGQRDFLVATGLVLVGVPLYLTYVKLVGMHALTNREDFGQKYLASAGLGPFAFGLPIIVAGCLWAEAGSLSKRARWCFRAVGFAVIVWSLGFISVRTNFAVLALGSIAIACTRKNIRLSRIRPTLVVMLVCGWALLEGFSYFRGAYKGDLSEAVTQVRLRGKTSIAALVGGSELAHPFITAAEVIDSEEAGGFAGQSLIDATLAFVPMAVVPDRPLAPSEWFARRHYSSFAKSGGGTGFSLVIEGWLDFGAIVGPFAFGLALGLLFTWIESRRSRSPHSLVMRLEPYFLMLIVIGHRNDIASLLKQVVSLSLVAAVVWVGAELALDFFVPGNRRRALGARTEV